MDVLSLSACVQAVTSAFRDAAGLVRRIKENHDGGDGEESWKGQIQELETSLGFGPPLVQGQYNSDFRKFGEAYARGDGTAREQLKDVLITLQMAVLSNLSGVLLEGRSLDHKALRDASDDSRVNAILCLIQWQQRLVAATATQQQKPTPSSLGADSRRLTVSSTNVSSHSGRSSLIPGHPFTSLSIVPRPPDSTRATPASEAQSSVQNKYAFLRAGGSGEIEIPSPLFALSRPSLSRRESGRSTDVPQAIPMRSPYRPRISTPQQAPQPRATIDFPSQGFSPPRSAVGTNPDHFGFIDHSRPKLPRKLEPSDINYAAVYSHVTQGAGRASSSDSRASQTQSASSDHSTIEPVFVLESVNVYRAYQSGKNRAQGYVASWAAGPPRKAPERPLPAIPRTKSQSNRRLRNSSISPPVPVLPQRSRTTIPSPSPTKPASTTVSVTAPTGPKSASRPKRPLPPTSGLGTSTPSSKSGSAPSEPSNARSPSPPPCPAPAVKEQQRSSLKMVSIPESA